MGPRALCDSRAQQAEAARQVDHHALAHRFLGRECKLLALALLGQPAPAAWSQERPAIVRRRLTERPIDGSVLFWRCLPDVFVVPAMFLFVQSACLLYRFDSQPSLEDADAERQRLIGSTSPQLGIELPIVTVPSAQIVIRERVRVLRAAGFSRGGYFGLAVMLGIGWQVLEPAARYILYVRRQLPASSKIILPLTVSYARPAQSDLIPLSALLPESRMMAGFGAAGTIAPAVYLKARLAKDLDRLNAYEED